MWTINLDVQAVFRKGRGARNQIANIRWIIEKKKKAPIIQGYYILPHGHVWLQELDCKEGKRPKNWCLWTVVLEKTPESPLDSKEVKPVNLKGNQPWIFTHWEDWCWSWSSSILFIWCKQSTHWKSPWYWGRLRAEVEEGVRGWDRWTASPMQWTWTWTNSGRWWETECPGMLQSTGLRRIGIDWVTEQQQYTS